MEVASGPERMETARAALHRTKPRRAVELGLGLSVDEIGSKRSAGVMGQLVVNRKGSWGNPSANKARQMKYYKGQPCR